MAAELGREVLIAFLVGGGFCVLGQLLFDLAKLTPAHTMSVLVMLGAVLGGLGIYPKIAEFAGIGATLPIVSFGNVLVKGALEGAAEHGFWGIWTGMLQYVSGGVAMTVFMAFAISLLFRPKS